VSEPPKTKAQEVYDKVESLMADGVSRSDAFKQVAAERGIAYNSARGAYYSWTRQQNGGTPRRTRRRETTPEDAVADARRALEAAIESIDAEVAAAKVRAEETAAEARAIKEAAPARKEAIQAKLTALS
jgi:hypothetical protein